MKTSRKLVVALTLAAMIATMIGTGVVSAAPTVQSTAFSDIGQSDYRGAINWLAALGIVNGRGGGIFDPSAQITRQEMAKIIINFMGQNALAQQLSATGSTFKDGNQIADWALGYVNAAAALGIINGYPDGTFKPNNKVLFQEVVTMLVRAIGDDFRAKMVGGTYPVNYLSVAAIAGVTKGLNTQAAALPASREEVAQLTYNAGSADRWVPTSYGPTGQVLTFGDNPDGDMFTAVTASKTSYAVATGQHVTAVSGNTLYAGGKAWTLADSVVVLGAEKLSDLVGKDVDLGVNMDSRKVAIVEVSQAPATATVSGTLNKSATTLANSGYDAVDDATYGKWYVEDGTGNTFVLFSDGRVVQLATGVKFQLNGGTKTSSPGAWGGFSAVVTLDSSTGLGTLVSATQNGFPYPAFVNADPGNWSSSATQSPNITAYYWSDSQSKLVPGTVVLDTNATKSATVNGTATGLRDAYAKIQSDVKAGVYPLIQVAYSSGNVAASISITDSQVSGAVAGVNVTADGTTVTIGSTTAALASGYAHGTTAKTPGNGDQNVPPVGQQVIALMTSDGAVQYMFGGTAPVTSGALVKITGISYSNNQYQITFDYEGSSQTMTYNGPITAGLTTGYAQVTVGTSGGNPVISNIENLVAWDDTYEVTSLTYSGSTVTFTLSDVISPATAGNPSTIGPASNGVVEVYNSDGSYNGTIQYGADYTVYHNAANDHWVLVKK